MTRYILVKILNSKDKEKNLNSFCVETFKLFIKKNEAAMKSSFATLGS